MTTMSNDYLTLTRKHLVEALGEKKHKYFNYMKLWFRMKISKEDFDSNARDLLPSDLAHLHNEFLLAILTKCQLFTTTTVTTNNNTTNRNDIHRHDDLQRADGLSFGSGNVLATALTATTLNASMSTPTALTGFTPIPSAADIPTQTAAAVAAVALERKRLKPKKKMKPSKPAPDSNFEPINLQDITPTPSLREPQAITDAAPGYHTRSLHLLDTGPLKGRLLLAAWDFGLTSVSDTVAVVLQEATKQCLKNILMAVVKRRRGFRIREGKFVHSLGTIPTNPWLRNTSMVKDWMSESLGLPFGEGSESGDRPVWPSVDAAEQNAVHLASCAPATNTPLPPISCADLFSTLQVHKNVLPSHSVYSLGMERISSHLWHPGWAELEQDVIAAQEAAVRDSIRVHRLATNPVS